MLQAFNKIRKSTASLPTDIRPLPFVTRHTPWPFIRHSSFDIPVTRPSPHSKFVTRHSLHSSLAIRHSTIAIRNSTLSSLVICCRRSFDIRHSPLDIQKDSRSFFRINASGMALFTTQDPAPSHGTRPPDIRSAALPAGRRGSGHLVLPEEDAILTQRGWDFNAGGIALFRAWRQVLKDHFHRRALLLTYESASPGEKGSVEDLIYQDLTPPLGTLSAFPPPQKRTFHLLHQADISHATNTR